MPGKQSRDYFCSVVSQSIGEGLFATASRVDVWFLLERDPPWPADVMTDARLSDAIRNHVRNAMIAARHAKFLFLRRSNPSAVKGPLFYVADSRPARRSLLKFQLSAPDDLLNLDLKGIASGESQDRFDAVDEPMFLVCTHGKHDQCCAKFGFPGYEEAARIRPDTTWQCSHIGGDRFAGNMVVLPHGLYYGNMTPESVAQIISATDRGEVVLQNFRGCSAYPTPVQAADYFLRANMGSAERDELSPVSSRRIADEEWLVEFLSAADGAVRVVHVRREPSGQRIRATCRATRETDLKNFVLVGISTRGDAGL